MRMQRLPQISTAFSYTWSSGAIVGPPPGLLHNSPHPSPGLMPGTVFVR